MCTNPLDQLKGICEQALLSVSKLNKSFKQFFIETMICYLSITGRVNFSQMARFSSSCESRFRQNFKKRFDWVRFNTAFTSPSDDHLRAIAIDSCFIPKSGKKTQTYRVRQTPDTQRRHDPKNYLNVQEITKHELKSTKTQRTPIFRRKKRRLTLKNLTNY